MRCALLCRWPLIVAASTSPCIGNAFATMGAQLILATVAQRYRLRLGTDVRVEPEPPSAAWDALDGPRS